MSLELVKKHLERWGRGGDVVEFESSTATVAEAALALGVEESRIAKSMALKSTGDQAIVVVIAGDLKLDNRKFKDRFKYKATMLSLEESLARTGHPPGGVCPFALRAGVDVFLDISLQRFETVFPACGTRNSAIRLTPEELELYSLSQGWVDICKARDP
jgi:prolyl-tRNA editing enzyme YbaK/EbsC (Cys-tRNA(Pro) deacylase)